MIIFGPASTWRLIPTEPVRLTYGEFANASTTVLMAAAEKAKEFVAFAIQSSCTKMSGLLTVAPIAGKSMNCPLIVTPLVFHASGIPSQVAELQSKTQATVALSPLPPERLAT